MANRHRAALAATAILCAVGSSLRADESYFVVRGSSWRYFRGLQEASPAEVSAWRQVEFDDSAWAVGSAPFGYGDPELGTDLSQQLPPMRNNYTCVFLRRLFEITDPAQVGALHANVDYDDGFVLWINGVEVVRDRVGQQSGDPVAFDAVAEFSHSAGAFENFDLPDPDGYLRAGINVVAVQAFNISLTSTDFLIDVELLDPFGPDLTPPAVEKIVPAPGTVVRSLDRISISFSEAVTGVSAADLLVGGQPASTLAGLGAGPYDFGFPPLPDGLVAVAWAAGHGIRDLGVPPNPFGGAPPWSYTVDSTLPAAELVVSEILAVNREGLLDEDGEASDWIEILNRGSIAVDLAGWSLSDDPRDPSRWTFPSRILGPGQYLVVFASGKDRRPAVGELHASFRLSSGGEYLALSSAESPPEVAFEYAPRFPEQRPDVSYGLDDSGALVFFTTPTPGGPNTSPTALGIVPEPVISVPRGFFDEPFLTDIGFSGADTVVFYTLDGAEPGPSSGQRYSVPIAIAGTAQRAVVTLRAAAYRPGYLPSRTVTATYIFPRHVLTQPALPAGFPSTWPGTTADYGFDARVINAAGNADLAIEGLLSIPTLSVVSDMANLFDPSTGNLMRPSMEGPAWERPVSAELILPDGKAGFQIDCGLRVQGGSSTSGWKSKKISLRLLFKGDYGSTKLRYRFFPDSPVERFDSIVLDAHLNLAWTHPDHGQRVRSQYVRDAFVSDLQLAAGSYAPHSRFVNLYINGLHWGIYDVHERPDASFAAEYFGGEKEDYDAMRHNTSTVVDGSSLAYSQMLAAARANLQNADSYQSLQQYLDVQDFADYMIVNLYAGNTDWAHQNWYATRLRAPGAAYRYHSWDAEHVLKSVTENVTGKNDSGGPTEVFQRLCANTDFRRLFGDRVQRLFFGSGALRVDPESPDWDEDHPERNRPAAIYMTRIREVDAAMVIESARWGDAQRPSQPYTRENEWMQELQWMLTQYFPRRSGIVLSQLRARSLYPQIAAPELSVPGGIVAPGFELSLSLPAAADGSIYYTTDGRDPRHEGTGGVAASALEYSTPLTIEDHTRVRARTLSGVDWSALTEAVFSVTDPRTSIRISEILYHAPEGSEHDFLELVNTAAATVDISGVRFTAGIDFSFPEGTTLGAGEYIVLASDPDAFAARYPGVPIGGVFSGSLDNAGERITIEDSRGRTVDSVEYDDEGFWPIGPDGFGFSLVRAHLGSDPDDPASWRASRHRGGSPGQADPQPLHGGVVINEVLSYSRGALEDAVELFNESAAPIDIGGWYLSDSRADEEKLKKYRIPDGTVIAAGGFAVFYEHELNADPDSELSFALSSSGDDIYLSSADASGELTGHIAGHEFDAAFEGISFGVHATSTGLDFTALAERTFGRDQPATVEEFRLGRGAPNAEPFVGHVIINEIHYHPLVGVEFLELHNRSAEAVPLHDAALGRGWRLTGIRNEEGIDSFEFPAGASMPAGGYLLVVPVDPESYRSLRPLPDGTLVFGPYSGALDNGGERIELLAPVAGEGDEPPAAVVDRVRYGDSEPWPAAADGDGFSLERVDAGGYGNEPLNWEASLVQGGTPGGPNSMSDPAVNRPPRPSFDVVPRPDQDPLAVLFDASRSVDPDGEIIRYEWRFGDGRTAEGRIVTHIYLSAGEYETVLDVVDDGGAVASATSSFVLTAGTGGGLQLPGDGNQDGRLDLSDAVSLLTRLFIDASSPLPCEPDDVYAPGNRTLLDVNADGGINLTDAVHILNFLFLAGPEPALGTSCIPIEGCPNVCVR